MSDRDHLVRWQWDDVTCDISSQDQPAPWCITLAMARQSTGEAADFEWNARFPDMLTSAPPDRLDDPARRDRPLLITHYQGMGDFIQQLRFLAAAELEGRRVLVECPAPLRALLEAQNLDVELVEPGCMRGDPPLDEACNMRLDHWLADPTDAGVYLKAPLGRRCSQSGRQRVGLNWNAKPGTIGATAKSVELSALEALVASRPGIDWVSLQWGPAEAELDQYPWAACIERRGRTIDTLARLADEIAELDLLITIDSAPAHLAGALGVPVWTMLGHAVGWRWRLKHTTSHLYGSMTLFRMNNANGWLDVIARVSDALDSGCDPSDTGAWAGLAQSDESVAAQFADDPLGMLASRGIAIRPDDVETLAGVFQLLVKCYGGFSWCAMEPDPTRPLGLLGELAGHDVIAEITAGLAIRQSA